MNMISETNRNRNKLAVVQQRKQTINVIQARHDSHPSSVNQNNSNIIAQENIQGAQQMQLPITYHEYQPNEKQFNSCSKFSQQSASNQCTNGQNDDQLLQILSLFGKLTEITNKKNKEDGLFKKAFQQMLLLHEKCLNSNMENKDIRLKQNGKWITLLINLTVNIWKILSQQSSSMVARLQILKKTSVKIISFLQRTKQKSSFSCLGNLSNGLKNKLILLLIIWAKQQLTAGNQEQALKICDMCSYQIIYIDSEDENSKHKTVFISKENKFKLHYLRTRIFKELGKEREQIQEIVICLGLAKIMGYTTFSEEKGANLEDEQNSQQNQKVKQKIRNNLNLVKKLQKRKNQILKGHQNAFKQISKSNQFKQVHFNSILTKNQIRVKQIRDSIQTKDCQKLTQNFYQPAEQSLKTKQFKIKRSLSSSDINNINKKQPTNKQGLQSRVRRQAAKNNFLSLHEPKKMEQTGKSSDQNGMNLKIKSPSHSVYLKSMSSFKRNSYIQSNSNKIKQKYELTTKKLAKRPILSSTKNKQFEDVLLHLQPDAKKTKGNASFINFTQLLAKRPEHKLKLSSNVHNQLDKQKQSEFNGTNVNDKKISDNQESGSQRQNNLKGITVPMQKIMLECIDKIQKETFQKYLLRNQGVKKKRKYQYNGLEELHSDDNQSNQESQKAVAESNPSQSMLVEIPNKATHLKQIVEVANQLKLYNRMQEQHIVQQAEPSVEFNINNINFPGLNLCQNVHITIKKMKQYIENSESKCKYSFIMNIVINSEIGVFCIKHKMLESLMQPNLSISDNINNNFKSNIYNIRVKDVMIPVHQYFTQEQQLSIKVMRYIKSMFQISNKGLGLFLEEKKKWEDFVESKPKYEEVFSRIYLQNRTTIQYLFSEQNLFTLSQFQASKNMYENMDGEQRLRIQEMRAKNEQKLKVMFVTIQKKNKRQELIEKVSKQQKKQKKSTLKNKKQKSALKQEDKSNFALSLFNLDFLNTKKQEQGNDSQQKEQIKKQNKRILIDKLLIPVVKYVLMGETSKPKHKLKTIIVKNWKSISDLSIFSSDQDSENENNKNRLNQKRISKQNRYGLLTPYIDDSSTIKIGAFSTSIYSQIIGRYFMGVDGRKRSLNSYQTQIPEDVMLSLKYYFMINNKSSGCASNMNTQKDNQICQIGYKNTSNGNMIQIFYDKFQYSMIARLKKNEKPTGNQKTYIIQTTLYRLKNLYRKGLEKFYILKFQVQQKNSRSQVNQLITTSFDIQRHFKGLQFDLIYLLDSKAQKQNTLYEQQIYQPDEKQNKSNIKGVMNTVRDSSGAFSNMNEVDSLAGQNQQQSFILGPANNNFAKSQAFDKERESSLRSEPYIQSRIKIHSQIQLEPHNQEINKKLVQQSKRFQDFGQNILKINHNFTPTIAINNTATLNSNRLSCPEPQVIQKLSINSISSKNVLSPFVSNLAPSKAYDISSQRERNIEQKNVSKLQLEPSLRMVRDEEDSQASDSMKIKKYSKVCLSTKKDHMQISKPKVKKYSEDQIAKCLRKIFQKMVIYKSLVHTKIGIQPSNQNQQICENQSVSQNKNEKIAFYVNKFRFSRNKNISVADQFLSPHLNCVQILFQKGIKIDCDNQFAIITVLKIKYCCDFYIKLYIPWNQKTMSFFVSNKVFLYFSKEDLLTIFGPMVKFSQQQFMNKLKEEEFSQERSVNSFDNREIPEQFSLGRSSKLQRQENVNIQVLKNKQIQYFVEKIDLYFRKIIYQNQQIDQSKNRVIDHQSSIKIIWSRIIKYLKFQRRLFGPSNTQDQENESNSFLVAQLGKYEAFVKGFCVDEYVNAKYGKAGSCQENALIQVQVSMGHKQNGLNYLNQKNFAKQSKVKKRQIPKKQSKKQRISQTGVNLKKMQAHQGKSMYQSETNKKIVYVSILNCRTNEKLCYNYYLCQLLHLIDARKDIPKNQQNDEESKQQAAYRSHSIEFRQVILNYALLFKVLNYIKNQFIIELQQSPQSYFPKLFKDAAYKNKLRQNVNKILLRQQKFSNKSEDKSSKLKKSQSSIKNLDKVDSVKNCAQNHNQGSIFHDLLNTMLNCTLKSLATVAHAQQAENVNLNAIKISKITFNSQIKAQFDPKLSLLVRKVIQRKGCPVSCIYLDKTEKIIKIYLTNCKTGKTQQVKIPIAKHPMPHIEIVTKYSCQKESAQSCTITSGQLAKDKQNNYLLALRNRLRRYHRNMTMLASM